VVVQALFALLCPSLVSASVVSVFEEEDPKKFCESAITQALEMLGGVPEWQAEWTQEYRVEQSVEKSSSYAEINQPKKTVTLFPTTFTRDPEGAFDCLNTDGLCGNVAVGVLMGVLYHEFLHRCYGLSPDGMLGDDCWREERSCMHLAIDYAVHSALCKDVNDILMRKCPNPTPPDPDDPDPPPAYGPDFCDDATLNQLIGMCEELRRLEKKWNDEQGEKVKMACRDGEGCGPPLDSECPTGNDILGNGDPSPYPPCDGTPVLDPCEACGGLTNDEQGA